MTTFYTRQFKNNTSTRVPRYDGDAMQEAAEQVIRVRKFAQVAGIRNAAKGLQTQGVSVDTARAILLADFDLAVYAAMR